MRVRLLVAVAVSALVVLSAPFMGQLRAQIRTSFPQYFVLIVGGAVAVAVAVALLAAIVRIRERRMLRYSAIVAALALAATYAFLTRSGRPDVDAVERVHFVEFGLITLLFYRAWRPLDDASILVLPVLAGILVGTFEEWLQWFIPNRVGEVKDIFLNCAAIGSGLLFSIGVDPPPAFCASFKPGSIRRIGALAALAVLVFSIFFQNVHLGYEIADSDATFRSAYTAEHLAVLSADRAVRWRTDPPLVLRRLSREDQYMTEGVTHVQERNEMWTAGDRAAAWRENRILEKYYLPVLETPSYVDKAGHRWSPEQRAEAEAAVKEAGASLYASQANPSPIYTWPKSLFWVVVAALISAIAAAAFLLDARRAAAGAQRPQQVGREWRRHATRTSTRG